MKTKIILLVATLSFSFSATNSSDKAIKEDSAKAHNEPIGGFVSEDKF